MMLNTAWGWIVGVPAASVLEAGRSSLFKLGADATPAGPLTLLRSPWGWLGIGCCPMVVVACMGIGHSVVE